MKTIKFCLQGSNSFELSFDVTANIKTAKVFIAHKFNTIPDNISLTYDKYVFLDDLLLKDINIPKPQSILISVKPSRTFKFLQPGKEVFPLPFAESATIKDAKIALSSKLKVTSDRITLCYDDQDLPDDQRLIDLNIPAHRYLSIYVTDDDIPIQKYLFMLQGEAKELPLSDRTTIREVKDMLIASADQSTIIQSIKLFHDGIHISNDNTTMGSLKIPAGDIIIAEAKAVSCRELRDSNHLKLPDISS